MAASKWPSVPKYYLSGGPFEAPPIPANSERIWNSFSMPLDPPCTSSSTTTATTATTATTTTTTLRDVNLNDFKDIVLELRHRYAELVWALSRMDSSKEAGYGKVTQLIDQQFVEAQTIVEAYHPKLVLLETLEQLKRQTQRREETTTQLLEVIGRAHDDLDRSLNK